MPSSYPKDKNEAVRTLKEETYQVQPGQNFQVARMEPEDAWGVARCFYQVYGEHYPFDTYYVPEKLIEANRVGDMISVVARTGAGDIIGFGSLFRNFAYNPRLYETGQATVIPEYRATLAVLCIQDYIFDTIASTVDIDAIFGEPVCNHLVMQKISSITGFKDTGIELGLMPGETYRKGDASGDRVSTVLSFKVLRDKPCRVYLPVEYETVLRSIISKVPLSRDIEISSAPVPAGVVSNMVTLSFDHSQAVRLSLPALGDDFGERLAEEEKRAWARGIAVFQVFVNLEEPWCGRAVSSLREKGFFFGGFLPQWFGSDGLLMQKLSALPEFDSVNLLSEDSRGLFEFIKDDIRK
jgi:hypothetical protein